MMTAGRSAEETRLAYLEDRVRSLSPIGRVIFSYQQAALNLRQAEKLIGEWQALPQTTPSERAARLSAWSEPHEKLMRAHAWITDLQGSLIERPDTGDAGTDSQVADQAQRFYALFDALLSRIITADRQRDAAETAAVREVVEHWLNNYWIPVRDHLEEVASAAERAA